MPPSGGGGGGGGGGGLLDPLLLQHSPHDVLDPAREGVGAYLEALRNVVVGLAERLADAKRQLTPAERRRLRYNALSYLMQATRRGLLQRYYAKLKGLLVAAGTARAAKEEAAVAGRLEWIEREYKRMANAIQEMLTIMAKDKDEKAVLQESTERIALVVGETTNQLEGLSKELSGVMFSANLLDFRRRKGDFLLLAALSHAGTRRRYYQTWLRWAQRQRKAARRQRKVTVLLQRTAKAILRRRLLQWMLAAQARVQRRLRARESSNALRRRTEERRLRDGYERWRAWTRAVREAARRRATELRRRRRLRCLLLKNEPEERYRWHWEALRRNVRRRQKERHEALEQRVGVLDAVLRQNSQAVTMLLTEMKTVAARHRRAAARSAGVLARGAEASVLRRHWQALAENRRRRRRAVADARGTRHLQRRTCTNLVARFYRKLAAYREQRARRRRVGDAHVHELAQRTWQRLAGRAYARLAARRALARRERAVVQGTAYLQRRNLCLLLRRYYDSLSGHRRVAVLSGATREDLGKVMEVVESLLQEVSQNKASTARQQQNLQKLNVATLLLRSRRSLLSEYYARLKALRATRVRRREQGVAADRLAHRNHARAARPAYDALRKAPDLRRARERRMARQRGQAAYLLPRTSDALRRRCFRAWLRHARGTADAGASAAAAAASRKPPTPALAPTPSPPPSPSPPREQDPPPLGRASHRRLAAAILARSARTPPPALCEAYETLRRHAARRRRARRAAAAARHLEGATRLRRLRPFYEALQRNAGAAAAAGRGEAVLERRLAEEAERADGVAAQLSELTRTSVAGVEARLREELRRLRDEMEVHADLVKQGEREASVSVASLHRQMQNTSSIINKLIDRLMAVDEFIAGQQQQQKEQQQQQQQAQRQPEQHQLPHSRQLSPQRSTKRAVPASHLSASRERPPLMPPGPPQPNDAVFQLQGRGASGSGVSPPRHRVPSSSALSHLPVPASASSGEHLTLLHATGQIRAPVSSQREW